MPTLVINAPRERVQTGSNYKSFKSIFNSHIGKDYAIYSGLYKKLYDKLLYRLVPGCKVILLSTDERLRAEGILIELIETMPADNDVMRYDVHMDNLEMVDYRPERLNKCNVNVI